VRAPSHTPSLKKKSSLIRALGAAMAEGVVQSDTLFRCLVKLLAQKQAFFSNLRGR
jgi:hypothetical protein